MVNEHYNAYNSPVLAPNGNIHLHSVSTSSAASRSSEATLVQIDSEQVSSAKAALTMGQSTTADNQQSLSSIRKNPIRSILKNGKVHSSSDESLLVAQPRTGILRKTSEQNGGPAQEPTSVRPAPVNLLPLSYSNDVSNVSAKSAASSVQFRIESTIASAASHEQSSDTLAMSSPAAVVSNGAASSARLSLAAATAATPSLQPLSVNHLKVPTPSHSSVIRPAAAFSSASSSSHQLAALHAPIASSFSSGSSHANTQYNLQPSYYTATTTQRMSDLRKILNPEVEKEDSFKKFTEAIENCDCFEFNLNNAAKLITVLVLLATLILVIRALKGDR